MVEVHNISIGPGTSKNKFFKIATVGTINMLSYLGANAAVGFLLPTGVGIVGVVGAVCGIAVAGELIKSKSFNFIDKRL